MHAQGGSRRSAELASAGKMRSESDTSSASPHVNGGPTGGVQDGARRVAQSARYHGQVRALTLLSGALSTHGQTAARALGEGAVNGLRQWLISALGPEGAYDLLQQAADGVGNEFVAAATTIAARGRKSRTT